MRPDDLESWDLRCTQGKRSLAAGFTLPPLLGLRELLGLRVVNERDQPLGHLADVGLGPDDGVIAYGVVAFATPRREKRFVAPWDALRYDADRRCLVWSVDREVLERSSGLMDDAPIADPRTPARWQRTRAERFGR